MVAFCLQEHRVVGSLILRFPVHLRKSCCPASTACVKLACQKRVSGGRKAKSGLQVQGVLEGMLGWAKCELKATPRHLTRKANGTGGLAAG